MNKPSTVCPSHSGFESKPHVTKGSLVALLLLFVWDFNNAFVFENTQTLPTLSL